MHDFESGIATLFNRRHDRTGALFQGRFRSEPVERDAHSWELTRYIHLNPVRAGIVAEPSAYPWSSYRYYLDPAGAPSWLDWRSVLAEFAGTEAAARTAYRRFVEAGIRERGSDPFGKLIVTDLVSDVPEVCNGMQREQCSRDLVSPRAAVMQHGPSIPIELEIETVVAKVADQFSVTPETVRRRGRHGNESREAAILMCRERTPAGLKVLADYFGGVSLSAITETVSRARRRMDADPCFRSRLESL